MPSTADPAENPDRMLADFFAEIEGSGELGEVDTERAVRPTALDEMVQIAEDAGMYERAARPRPMR